MNARMVGRWLGLFAALLLLPACSAPAEKTDKDVRPTPTGATVTKSVGEDGNITYSGTLSGGGKLTRSTPAGTTVQKGEGETITLTGTNTYPAPAKGGTNAYTGPTTITAGTIDARVIPFLGSWALTIPNGTAGWLGVEQNNGKLAGSILWEGGSVLPVDGMKLDGDKLVVTRFWGTGPKDRIVETITAIVAGDDLKAETVKTGPDGKQFGHGYFTGKRTPPLPPAPDMAKVRFGEPITLFNGKNLDGWKLTPAGDGQRLERQRRPVGEHRGAEPGKPHKAFGNLRTVREFEDFRITLEVNVPPEGNSGVYLRGIYEVQVFDSFGKPVDCHNMGAIYSRITPSEAAEKPAGQWQTMDMTLVDRHATVILNGKKIIDNKPLLGCTGGRSWPNLRPGPIYLQGDHTGATYRNIVLTPVVK